VAEEHRRSVFAMVKSWYKITLKPKESFRMSAKYGRRLMKKGVTYVIRRKIYAATLREPWRKSRKYNVLKVEKE
jgi:hypothetical protein